jgi:hypothetical protein
MIGAKWYGFADPQSGLSHYEWWAGLSPTGNDSSIHPPTSLHLAEIITVPRLAPDRQLPVGTRVYVSVRAHCQAGTDKYTLPVVIDTLTRIYVFRSLFIFFLIAYLSYYMCNSCSRKYYTKYPEISLKGFM